MTSSHEPVVVVGAGPVGLTAALALARQDLPVLVLEAEPENRARPGSRAIFLMAPTLHRFEKLVPGMGAQIGAAGVQVRGYDAYYAGRRVFAQPMPSLPPLRSLGASLPQKETERILFAECVRMGVQFRWDSPVSGVRTTGDGVSIDLLDGQTIDAPYVIAADGARSVVRKSLGIPMEGHTDDTPFLIVDVSEHPDGSTPRTRGYFHYESPDVDGRNVMHMPFAGGMRVDLQCTPTDDVEWLASPDGLKEWLPKVVDPWYAEHVTWVSTYRFQQLVAQSYADPHGRVLLAGEAAHLFAPWGGRGLNSGVMDATDAAAAIATGDPQVIARCASDRRRWGLHNREVSSRGLRQMRAPDRAMQLQRRAAARVAPLFWPAGAWLANGPIQLPTPRLGTTALY